jgi:hypothetical protein
VVLATMLGGAGCGGPVKRAISGSVTLEGKPLDEAVIMFVPLDIQAGKTGAAITQGRYEVPRDVGLLPGRYRVEIADDPPIDHASMGHPPKPVPARRRLPVHYSVASPLSIDIAPTGPTEFDFPLTSKPSRTP